MAETVPFKRDTKSTRNPDDPSEPASKKTPSDGGGRVYTNEEVSEIIRVALRNAKDGGHDMVDHEEMLAIGADFGLTAADISRAFDELGRTRQDQNRSETAMLAFKVHAMVFAVVNVGLFLINWLSMPDYWWFLYPLVSWGMLIALHGLAAKYVPAVSAFIVERSMDLSRDIANSHFGENDGPVRATFTIPKLYSSLAEAKGLAQVRDDCLLLEFEISDTIFHTIKSKVKELVVPISEITSVRLERRLWATKLVLQGIRLRTFEGVPGGHGGEITLVFDRQTRAASEQLAREINSLVGREA